MNLDDFEQHLARQPLRNLPAEWRAEILDAAREPAPRGAQSPRPPAPESLFASLTAKTARWREWFWPSPAAWGALAACWVGVLFLNLAAAPDARERAVAQANARLARGYLVLVGLGPATEPQPVGTGVAQPAAPSPRPPEQGFVPRARTSTPA